MSCPYSDEELQEWDSVCNPMGDACSMCQDCDCDHWAGSCEGCEPSEKWLDCGGPWARDAYPPESGHIVLGPPKKGEEPE